MIIPLGAPFIPDQPSLGSPGVLSALNVIPAARSYRPISDLSAYSSNALSARCQGAACFSDTAGNVNGFAGTASTLERLTGGSTAWSDVSKTGGYSTASDERWTFAYNGADLVVATNFSDPVQAYTIGSSTTFDDLIQTGTTSLKARYAAFAKGFLILLNTNDSTDGNRPSRVWWSALGDPTDFPTAGTSDAIAKQSDFQDVAEGDLGWGQGIAVGLTGADVLLFFERGLVRMTYVGGDVIWQIDIIEGARGTPAPGSIVQRGAVAEFLSDDGWYATNGAQAEPIGNDPASGGSVIDKFFFADTTHGLDQANYSRISGTIDPINKVCMWAYPSVSGTAGNCDRVLIHNWAVNRWSLITGLGDLELLAKFLTIGYSLDTLDSLGNIDTLPYSLDSRQLTGGQLLISAFKTDHVLYTFTGDNLAATIDTAEFEPVAGQRAMVTGARPLVEGTDVTPTLAPITRNLQSAAKTVGTAVSMDSTGRCPLRTNARYQGLRISIPAGSTWTHAHGVEVDADDIKPMGKR